MSSSDLHELLASGQAHLLLGPPQGTTTGRPSNSGLYQRDSNSLTSGANDAKPSSVATFQSLIKKWEEEKNGSNYDPTETLNEMAEILEKVIIANYSVNNYRPRQFGFLGTNIIEIIQQQSFFLNVGTRRLFIQGS